MTGSGKKTVPEGQQGGKARPTARRPAAPAAPAAPKVLRIGVIQGGKIVEERIIRRRETVTVGPSEKAHFVFAAPDLPSSRFELFETRGEEYTLNFTESMSGRISLEGTVAELAELRKSGRARAKGRVFQLVLNDQVRGKISMGESTILFQFVAPPPMQPRPQLPAAVRGNLLANAFNLSTLCILFFLVIEAALCIWWANTDWPKPNIDEQFQSLKELIQPRLVQLEKPKSNAASDDQKTDDAEKEDAEKDKKKDKKDDWKEDKPDKEAEEAEARRRAAELARLQEEVAAKSLAKILGASGGNGAIANVMQGGDVSADQDQLLSQANGIGGAAEEGALSGPAGAKGSGEAADISQIKVKGDKDVATAGPGEEKKVTGHVKKKDPSISGGSGTLDQGEVARIIGGKQGAIKGCYEQALKRNPALKGKITIVITIGGTGRVSSAKCTVNELTPEVCSCITDMFNRVRFPPPENGSVEITAPFFLTPGG